MLGLSTAPVKGSVYSDPQLRLALLAALKLEPGSLAVLAPVCSSMGFLASSVTKRNCMVPLGDPSVLSVAEGNLLAFRTPDSKELNIFYKLKFAKFPRLTSTRIIGFIVPLSFPHFKGLSFYVGCWLLLGIAFCLNSHMGLISVLSHTGVTFASIYAWLLGWVSLYINPKGSQKIRTAMIYDYFSHGTLKCFLGHPSNRAASNPPQTCFSFICDSSKAIEIRDNDYFTTFNVTC